MTPDGANSGSGDGTGRGGAGGGGLGIDTDAGPSGIMVGSQGVMTPRGTNVIDPITGVKRPFKLDTN